MKIHYVGYSTCFDEWRPFRADRGSGYFPFVRSEKLFIPSENSLEDRKESFHGQLAREIKKKLWSGRREDPDINVDLNVDQDVFMEGLESDRNAFNFADRVKVLRSSLSTKLKQSFELSS